MLLTSKTAFSSSSLSLLTSPLSCLAFSSRAIFSAFSSATLSLIRWSSSRRALRRWWYSRASAFTSAILSSSSLMRSLIA
ncbi:MAG: hypothetical protein QXM81_03505 [Nitrososphaerota archaeon]